MDDDAHPFIHAKNIYVHALIFKRISSKAEHNLLMGPDNVRSDAVILGLDDHFYLWVGFGLTPLTLVINIEAFTKKGDALMRNIFHLI